MAVFALVENGGLKEPTDDMVIKRLIFVAIWRSYDTRNGSPPFRRPPEKIWENAWYFLNSHRLIALSSGRFEHAVVDAEGLEDVD